MHEINAVQLINNQNYCNNIELLSNNSEFSEELLLGLLSLANNMPGIAYWKNKEGIYLWHNDFNEINKKLFRLPSNYQNNIVGKTDYDIFSFNIANEFRQDDLEAMLSKQGLIKEELLYDEVGHKYIIFSYKRPLVNQKGEVIGIIGNILKLTDDKHVNIENLKEANKTYNFTIEVMKEITLLINLIEINGDSEFNITMLSEISAFINMVCTLINNKFGK